MTFPVFITRAHRRRQLLGGTATALAVLLAASSAQAQTSPVQASGGQVLANDQSSSGGQILADASGNTVNGVAGPLADAKLAITDNRITTTGRINRVVQTIDQAPLDIATRATADLTASASRVTGNADTLIANRQSVLRTELDADVFDTVVGLQTGTVAQSRLAVTGNAADADARGNDAAASLAADANELRDGIGIVSSQSITSSDGPSARVRNGASLTTGAASDSSLNLSGNRATAHADGNMADNSLTASAATLFVPLSTNRGAVVPTGSGDASSSAALGLLTSQSASGTIKTVVGDADTGGPAFQVKIAGRADGISLDADGNTLAATTAANRIANVLDASAVRIAPANSSEGPAPAAIANLTSVQRATGAVQAITTGGTIADVDGGVADSTISLSGNRVEAAATANLVTSNRLALSASTIDPSRGGPLSPGAWVSGDGSAATDASVALENVQDYGTSSVVATVIRPEARLTIGPVTGTRVSADGNSTSGRAIGNSAANALAVDAGLFGATAALNNVQSGDGNLAVTIGAPTEPGGVRISPDASFTDSHLSASNNTAAGAALGNAATNEVTVHATELSGGMAPSVSGPVGSDYGATGALVLSSSQKLGQPSTGGTLTPRISATVYDRVGFGNAVPVTGSAIVLDDNRRSAAALGNTVANHLTLDAGAVAPGAGAALASTQYGQANVLADLRAATGTSGALDGASVSISGNTATALAAINDADNALVADLSAGTQGLGTANVHAAPLGPPAATGEFVLTSQQFATGSATANIKVGTGDVDSPLGMRDSRFTISGNSNIAEASANRAVNTASLTSAQAMRGVGVANSQTSMAQVQSSATTGMGYLAPLANPVAVAGSAITVEGNSSTALARGNVADNRIAVDSAAAEGAGAAIDTGRDTIDAPTGLLNSQANYGAVSAVASGRGYLPLNAAPNAVQTSSLTATGNSAAASAYGNIANNAITTGFGQFPGVGLANVQVNYGSVSAQVTGTGTLFQSGPVTGSTVSVTGNSLAATAVGNQANSMIASPR